MRVLTLIGSLRAASFGKRLAGAIETLAPAHVRFDRTDGRDLPLYDQDLEGDDKPAAVLELFARIEAADALLFLTPEYNYGIPGPLKNLVDWASRPAFRSPIKDNPATIVAYSPAPTGGARSHAQLAQVLAGTLTLVMPGVSLLVPAVHEKFDEAGSLTDEDARRRLARQIESLEAWTRRMKSA
ncbi:MAG TPA: NADPH-dependent FMN reductase [Myxococcota bacterium]|nr:NADPH-dependent FMN reductase [Myxococcota bacterium]